MSLSNLSSLSAAQRTEHAHRPHRGSSSADDASAAQASMPPPPLEMMGSGRASMMALLGNVDLSSAPSNSQGSGDSLMSSVNTLLSAVEDGDGTAATSAAASIRKLLSATSGNEGAFASSEDVGKGEFKADLETLLSAVEEGKETDAKAATDTMLSKMQRAPSQPTDASTLEDKLQASLDALNSVLAGNSSSQAGANYSDLADAIKAFIADLKTQTSTVSSA